MVAYDKIRNRRKFVGLLFYFQLVITGSMYVIPSRMIIERISEECRTIRGDGTEEFLLKGVLVVTVGDRYVAIGVLIQV